MNNIIRYKNDKVKNNEIKKIELIPDININLFIKQFKKKTCEKMTEITPELNPILPCNNYELYIDRIIKRIIYINNKEQEISFIKKIDDGKNKIIYNSIFLYRKSQKKYDENDFTNKTQNNSERIRTKKYFPFVN